MPASQAIAPKAMTARAVADPLLRKDLRRQATVATLAARERRQAGERHRRALGWGAAALLAVVALGGLTFWLTRPVLGSRVQTFPNQGQTHIQHGQAHPAYNSTPPTSGWHYADQVAPWGISAQPLPHEVQVHNLEHGGVVIQYDCPDGCPEVVSKLEAIVRSYPSKVVLAPYAGIPGHRLALTAWTRLAYLDDVDEAFIRQFVASYRNQGPEQVPDM